MNTDRLKFEFIIFLFIFREQVVTISFVVLSLFSFTLGLFYSWLLSLALIICYVVGSYLCHTIAPLVPKYFEPVSAKEPVTFGGCGVCGDPKCSRQKQTADQQPWLGLQIPREIDQALQDLLNKLLNEYVGSWYCKLSRDESFLWEIRVRLRYATSVLLRRMLKLNVGEVICERLVPLYLRHVEDFIVATDGLDSNEDKVATTVSLLGERLHPAAKSRQHELEYLRAISKTLCRIGLYKSEMECKCVSFLLVELLAGWLLLTLSDTLSNPFTINALLWLAATSNRRQPVVNRHEPKVEFLKAFAARPYQPNTMTLRPDLSAILKDTKLLYPFIQHLKRCGVVNLLQFCLDVEEFNQRLLVPDLPLSTASGLYAEARGLFSQYLKPESSDYIHCSSALSQQMDLVLNSGNEDVTRLQTSTPLFQAYEETFCLLEQTYLPTYFQSDLYFQTLGGSVPTTGQTKVVQKKNEPLVMKLSQKLHKLVSGQPLEDSSFIVETAYDAADIPSGDELDMDGGFDFKDMSDWRTTIPSVEIVQDSNTAPYAVFCIRVYVDEDESWEVRRKFDEFYLLQTKLLEFHQKLVEELPPKKSTVSPHGTEYLESKRQALEVYLQKLILQPELRCSDLLHLFLRSPAEFQIALRNPLSITGLLRRSVQPIKLRKTRGRRLESFLQTLLISTETPSKSVQNELLEPSLLIGPPKRDVTCGIFGDNLAKVLAKTKKWPPTPVRPILKLATFWDSLQYIMWRLIGCSKWVRQFVVIIKRLLGHSGSPLVHNALSRRIQDLLLPRLPLLIRLLQGAILSPSRIYTAAEHEDLRQGVLNLYSKHGPLLQFLAPKWSEGMDAMIGTLQHPTLNKHLFYSLLDEILLVLFPEFSAPNVDQES